MAQNRVPGRIKIVQILGGGGKDILKEGGQEHDSLKSSFQPLCTAHCLFFFVSLKFGGGEFWTRHIF